MKKITTKNPDKPLLKKVSWFKNGDTFEVIINFTELTSMDRAEWFVADAMHLLKPLLKKAKS